MGGLKHCLFGIVLTWFSTLLIASPVTLIDTIPQDGFALGGAVTAGNRIGFGPVYKNPAGITTFQASTFKTSYSSFFQDQYQGVEIAYARPVFSRYTLGVLLPIRTVSSLPKTVEVGGKGVHVGHYSDVEGQAIFSLGYNLSESLRIGSNLSFSYHRIYNHSTSHLNLDFGILKLWKTFSMGLSIQQLGTNVRKWSTGFQEDNPIIFNGGIVSHFLDGRLTVLSDFRYIKKQDVAIQSGVKYHVSRWFDFQLGIWDVTGQKQFRMGTVLTLGKMTLEYAFSQSSSLGNVQKMGFSLDI